MFKNIKTSEDLANEAIEADNNKRIAELKQLLQDSDFKVLPDYDQDNTQIKTDRLEWRKEIRQLEESL